MAGGGTDGTVHVGIEHVAEVTGTRQLTYDKSGDAHYDVVSAFIKSMRGSDPDAAVYWLARMIDGGEDPRFIARRMLIFASEDVGMADPQALLVAAAAVKSAEFIGWPECRINLSHAAIYLAVAQKSNAAYTAIDEALAEVREGPARPVPPAGVGARAGRVPRLPLPACGPRRRSRAAVPPGRSHGPPLLPSQGRVAAAHPGANRCAGRVRALLHLTGTFPRPGGVPWS